MLRAVLSVASLIVGYVVMVIVVSGLLALQYLMLGTERTFHPGTYDPTLLANILMLVFSLLSALLGGWLCKLISRSRITPLVFAVIILVMGVVLSLLAAGKPPTNERRGPDVPIMEAVSKGVTPTWVNIATAVIGAAGIVAGAELLGKKPGSKPNTPPQPAN